MNRQQSMLEVTNLGRARQPLRVTNTDDAATVYVYDMIGGWEGVQAQEFVEALNAITAPRINLRINSPGGSVFDGRAMAAAVQQHPSMITAYIDGLAASAASWLALAADEVVVAPGSFVMIHNSQGISMGDKRAMTDMAGLLNQLDETFVVDYSNRTRQTPEQIRDWMDAETWFNAEQAVAHGFATRVAEGAKTAGNQWNLAAYSNAPPELTAAPAPATEPTDADDALVELANIAFANHEHRKRVLALLDRIAA